MIRNAPVDAAGAPFPTTYWLTCPDAVKAISRVESQGWIGRLNERMRTDAPFGAAVEAAHAAYAVDRAGDLAAAGDWGGVAGTRVGIKCLHAHYAYRSLAATTPRARGSPNASSRCMPDSGRAGSPRSIRARTRSGCSWSSPARRRTRRRPSSPATWSSPASGATSIAPAGSARMRWPAPWTCSRGSRRRARALGAERIRVGATSAVRDAENRDDYAAAVRELAGSELEVDHR